MKLSKYYFIPAVLAFAFVAQAQTSGEDIQETINERRAEMQETMEARQEQMQERQAEVQQVMEERRAALTDRMQERITNLAANMSNRFDNVITRLQNIIDRVDSRITKVANEGGDTTEAEAALARAQNALNQAKSTMSDIDAEVAGVVGSPEPRTEWQSLKASYLLSKELIKTTHFELRNAISSLKSNTASEVETEEENEDETDEEVDEETEGNES